MRAAVFFLLLAYGSCQNYSMEVWEKCTKSLRKSGLMEPEKLLVKDVLGHCHYLWTEVGRCLADKLNIDNDGSKAARGQILVDMIDLTNRNEEVIKTARYYHYACVYNDIGIWIRNESCYFHMLQNCVLKDGDCYGMMCHSDEPDIAYKTEPNVARAVKSGQLDNWFYFPALMLLFVISLY